ncbi:MAG: hypothetical protein ACRDSF_11400 [Pseudonocardiaceae bacterium]
MATIRATTMSLAARVTRTRSAPLPLPVPANTSSAAVDEVRDRAAGVLLITHDRLLAAHWCDRIVELPALGTLAAVRER